MGYPQTRVFDPITILANVALPQESPYLELDTTAGVIQVNADALADVPGGYSAVYYFTHVAGGNKITLLCPTGWRTPGGLNTNFDLPGSAQGFITWIVLYNAVRKSIVILNTEFTPSVFPLGLFLPFAGGVNPNSTTYLANSSGASVATIPLQYGIGVPFRHQQTVVFVSLNGLSHAAGLTLTLFKNGITTGASVNIPALATGPFLISNQVDYVAGDTFDIQAAVGAGGTAARLTAVLTGDYTTSP